MTVESIHMAKLQGHLARSAEVSAAVHDQGLSLFFEEITLKSACSSYAVDSEAVSMLKSVIDGWQDNDENAQQIYDVLSARHEASFETGDVTVPSAALFRAGVSKTWAEDHNSPERIADFFADLEVRLADAGLSLDDVDVANHFAQRFPGYASDTWADQYESWIAEGFDPVLAAQLSTRFKTNDWEINSDGTVDLFGEIRAGENPWIQDWNREVVGLDLGGLEYSSYGFISAPNGLDYPLVVPSLLGQGENVRVSGFTHGDGLYDLDPGWVVVDSRNGLIDGPHENGFWASVAAAGAGTSPNNPGVSASSAEFYLALTPDANGFPRFASDYEQFESGGVAVRLPNLTGNQGFAAGNYGPNGLIHPAYVPRAPQAYGAQTGALVGGGASLFAAVVGGAVNVADLHAADVAGYQVIYEANPDGRTRARVHVYYADSGRIYPFTVRADADGAPQLSAATFREPYAWDAAEAGTPPELPDGIRVDGIEPPH